MPVDPAATPTETVYGRLDERVAVGRRRLGRPLTLAEKILFNHLNDPEGQELDRGHSYAEFRPDRVACQDATAQMAILQFMTAGLPEVAVPTTIHCEYLIKSHDDAASEMTAAEKDNAEVYEYLRSPAHR